MEVLGGGRGGEAPEVSVEDAEGAVERTSIAWKLRHRKTVTVATHLEMRGGCSLGPRSFRPRSGATHSSRTASSEHSWILYRGGIRIPLTPGSEFAH